MQYKDDAEEGREEQSMRIGNIGRKFLALLMAMIVVSSTISSSLIFAEESNTESAEEVDVTEDEAVVEEQELPENSVEVPESIESEPVESEVVPVETEKNTEQTENPASETAAAAERKVESNEGTEAVAIEPAAIEPAGVMPLSDETEAAYAILSVSCLP